MYNNIVEYFSGHEGYRCGYCKSTDTNFSHGMWAHSISPAEYESLLDRGWRRSGKYLYKPTNHLTCCPSYTINCHALEFRISKSQKKVLKKVNDFFRNGNIKAGCRAGDVDGSSGDHKNITEVINYRESTTSSVDLSNSKAQSSISNPKVKVMGDSEHSCNVRTSSSDSRKVVDSKRRKSETSTSQHVTPDSQQCPLSGQQKAKGQKAKFLRLERRRQKLVSKGLTPDEVIVKTKKTTPQTKEIEAFFLDIRNAKHNLEICMVRVGSDDFDSTFNLEHTIYQKYQMKIHDDTESECNAKQFRRFLCDNPFIESSASDNNMGCYHQQYYLDNQLIAVGVVDILATCLSSVYFFYDPAFMDLTLGTYGALQEIAFVRHRALTNPNFKFYYMGFYIHSCPKMRYKGNYTPSYLLCSETYKWKKLDDELRGKLNQSSYLPFFTSEIKASKSPHQEDINKVSILYRRNIVPYGIYELQRGKDDTREIQEYVNLVGVEIASKICLYRSLL